MAAAEEAARLKVVLRVVHAVDYLQPEALYLFGLTASSVHAPERERLSRLILEAGVEATGEIIEGPPAAAIVRDAEAIGAGLVVVGSHGTTGFTRLLLGSVAEKVVRAAPCSVLIARLGYPSWSAKATP
jgi:nucleotide-binding universal stress UspA family protein